MRYGKTAAGERWHMIGKIPKPVDPEDFGHPDEGADEEWQRLTNKKSVTTFCGLRVVFVDVRGEKPDGLICENCDKELRAAGKREKPRRKWVNPKTVYRPRNRFEDT
jgi:hypothetical protein